MTRFLRVALILAVALTWMYLLIHSVRQEEREAWMLDNTRTPVKVIYGR
jgi:hypothetical protein